MTKVCIGNTYGTGNETGSGAGTSPAKKEGCHKVSEPVDIVSKFHLSGIDRQVYGFSGTAGNEW